LSDFGQALPSLLPQIKTYIINYTIQALDQWIYDFSSYMQDIITLLSKEDGSLRETLNHIGSTLPYKS
jgi:hypothetical protein